MGIKVWLTASHHILNWKKAFSKSEEATRNPFAGVERASADFENAWQIIADEEENGRFFTLLGSE